MNEELRNALFSYKFGSIIGKPAFGGCDISDVREPRIAIFGQTGAGKSAFICSCERALFKTKMGSAPIQTLGGEGTILLEDYLTGAPFRLVDTRGYFNYDRQEISEFLAIMQGKIKSGQLIKRDASTEQNREPKSQFKIHSAIVVLKADDPRLLNQHYEHYYEFLRMHFRNTGLIPITVVTHKDKMTGPDLDQSIALAKKVTNSAEDNIFCIKNYTSERESDDDIDDQVLRILHSALRSSELFVKHEKTAARMSKYFKK